MWIQKFKAIQVIQTSGFGAVRPSQAEVWATSKALLDTHFCETYSLSFAV
jgi:hypothetical protein